MGTFDQLSTSHRFSISVLVLALFCTLVLAGCADNLPSTSSSSSDFDNPAADIYSMPVTDVAAPPEYLFEPENKTVYLTCDTQLRSFPVTSDNPDVEVSLAGEELSLLDIPRFTELRLTGINDYPYWRIEHAGATWYVDSSAVTDNIAAIDEMRQAEKTQAARDALVSENGENLIVLGDSRTVGMQQTVRTNARLIGKVSMGYNWMMSTAIPQAESVMGDNSIIVFAFGVNDLGNVGKYISAMNAFKERHPNNTVGFLSVNPVDEGKCASYGYSVGNSAIASFNEKVRASLSENIVYIDSYEHMMAGGFSTADGIHYTAGTYKDIYDYMLANVL